MMLVEQTTLAASALPLAAFRDHLRLGSGFDDDTIQDAVLETALRAAIAAIEGRTGKVLLSRLFSYRVGAWRDLAALVLPLAPVRAISALTLTDRLGADEVIDPTRYRLDQDMHRPRLVANGLCLPSIPVSGEAVVSFEAGFGPAWADVPADLAQAVFLLAAAIYENRAGGADMPAACEALIQRYRPMRLFGGGGA